MIDEQKPPFLSVAIIGNNEAARIHFCIASINKAIADIDGTEVVYVDSGSTDTTVQIALSLGVRVVVLGTVQSPSPAAGRYVGAEVTSGKYIMFVDGDSVIASGWVRAALEIMENDPDIAIFAGQFLRDPHACLTELPSITQIGKIRPAAVIGGGRAPIIRRSDLAAAGNWNPFVRAEEERDLAIRLQHFVRGAKLLQIDTITVYSPVFRITVKEIIRRWRRGFVKGPGQIFKTSIAEGYWRKCLYMMRYSMLIIAFFIMMAIAILIGWWWQYLVCCALLLVTQVVFREKITWAIILHCIAVGVQGIVEFFTVSARTGKNYICDFREVTSQSACCPEDIDRHESV